MRFHVLHSPLGTLLAYHIRQTLSPKHAISLVCNPRNVVPKQASTNSVVSIEHAGVTMSIRNIDFEFHNPNGPSRKERSGTSTISASPAQYHNTKPIESPIVTTPPTTTHSTLSSPIHRSRLEVRSSSCRQASGFTRI